MSRRFSAVNLEFLSQTSVRIVFIFLECIGVLRDGSPSRVLDLLESRRKLLELRGLLLFLYFIIHVSVDDDLVENCRRFLDAFHTFLSRDRGLFRGTAFGQLVRQVRVGKLHIFEKIDSRG